MGWIKFVACADLHGDNQDAGAVRVFKRFVGDYRPDVRAMLGDCWDFRPLRAKATDEEKNEDMTGDWIAGKRFLEWYRPQYFLEGNHEARLHRMAEFSSGLVRKWAEEALADYKRFLRELKCRVLPYHKSRGVLRLGHLKLMHGFFTGKFAAKRTAEIYGSVLMGHTHTVDEFPVPSLDRRVARCIGCLCLLDLDYDEARPDTLRHAHGWAYGVISDKTGAYHVNQAECIEGKWLLPAGFKEY